MENTQSPITLESLCKRLGIPEKRHQELKKIYEQNRHNHLLLRAQFINLPRIEVTAINAYIGAIIAGRAVDEQLQKPNSGYNPSLYKNLFN